MGYIIEECYSQPFDDLYHFHEPYSYIGDLCDAVYRTLKLWVAVHEDNKAWAAMGLGDMTPLEWLECTGGRVGNNYYNFDLTEALIEAAIENEKEWWYQCPECDRFYADGWEPDEGECEDDQTCDPDNFVCLDEVDDLSDFIWYMKDFYCDGIPENITNNDVLHVMENQAFNAYYEALEPVFCGNMETIKQGIKNIEAATDNHQLLAAVIAGTALYHVHGNVMDDYGEYNNLDGDLVDDIRNNGLTAVYTEDDIDEFIEGELFEVG